MHLISLMSLTKTCRGCGGTKELREFHRHRRGLYGRDTICRPCDRTKTYSWRAANPDGHAEAQRAYRGRHPERVKAQVRRWQADNPEYERARSRRRWRENPEPLRRSKRRWAVKNRHRLAAYALNHARAVAAGGRVAPEYLAHLKRQPCAYCGGPGGTIDHVVPVSRGGQHSVGNVVAACHSCNASKSDRTPAEWFAGVRARRQEAA